MTPVGKINTILEAAFEEAFDLCEPHVHVAVVRDDGTEDPARVRTPIRYRDNRTVEFEAVTFQHETGTQLHNGTYNALRLYNTAGDLLTQIKTSPKIVQGSTPHPGQPAPWWRFWNRRDTGWQEKGDTLTFPHISVTITGI